MNCRKAVGLLSADIDGELPPDETQDLAAHLAACAACAGQRRRLEKAWEAFLRVSPEPPSAGFDDAVRRRLASRSRPVWWLVAAAIVAALGVGVLRYPGRAPISGPVGTRASIEAPDPDQGLDCGLPGATSCVIDTAATVVERPRIALTWR